MCAYCAPSYSWAGQSCVSCVTGNALFIVLYVILTLLFVGYVYWSTGSETVSKLNIFLNYLQLLAQSYVIQSIKFLPMAELSFTSVSNLANVCFLPLKWWEQWVFIMMTPWIYIAVVGLFFVGRLLYKTIHRACKHPDRKCSDRENRKSVPVNSIQAIIQLIFFNNLSIAKSCMIMFACTTIFDNTITTSNYSFQCGTSLHTGFIIMSVMWLLLFCVFVPLVVFLAIMIPNGLPTQLHDLLDVEFLTTDFKPFYKWWEVIFNVRRLVFAIIVIVVSIQPNLKVMIFAIFAISFAFLQLRCWPYKKTLDNVLEFIGLAAIVVTFVIQAYTLAYGDPNDVGLIFVVVLNGIVTGVLLLFLLIDAVPMVIEKLRACFENHKRRRDLRAVGVASKDRNRSLTLIATTVGGAYNMTDGVEMGE
jgi:hypothetical protein